jgi:hypothetical protein
LGVVVGGVVVGAVGVAVVERERDVVGVVVLEAVVAPDVVVVCALSALACDAATTIASEPKPPRARPSTIARAPSAACGFSGREADVGSMASDVGPEDSECPVSNLRAR